MQRRKTALAAAVLIAFGLGAGPLHVGTARADACMPGDKIDGSTAAQATQKIEAGDYGIPSRLRKGCDNYWHADAYKGGALVHVVLSPEGQLLTEGD
jgi:hypothetical protein